MKPHSASPASQHGVVLVISLLMLVMLTMIVTTAFLMGTTTLRAVGNMQYRDESLAAANAAIGQVASSSNFYTAQSNQDITIYLDNNASNSNPASVDVVVSPPTCVRSFVASAGSGATSLSLGTMSASGKTWYTEWDIAATATNQASGAQVTMHQGISTILSDSDKTKYCP